MEKYDCKKCIYNGKGGVLNRNKKCLNCTVDSNCIKEKPTNYKEKVKKVCVSLKELYKKNGAQLHYGGYIDFYSDEESEYYDLRTESPDLNESKIICCDGEECEIIHEGIDVILCSNSESGNRFYLTREEYEIAIFE